MKNKLSDLAVMGGDSAFPEKLHVGKPNIGNREHFNKRINDIFDRCWLTNAGVYEQEFEQRLAEMLGVRHCISMCNGTVALEIAIRASGLSGEVIVPSLTFIATAHSLQWQQITPVFCDVDPDTYNIDPSRIEDLITPRTTGIIGVHLWGRPCDVDALANVARKNNLKLIYDAAHALGCSSNGRMIGGFGDAEVLSFHATKFINSFEGGAVVTNNDELAGRIRLMKNFGFSGPDNVVYIGTNGKMSEASAAMGLTSLESMEEFIEVNRMNYMSYRRELADIPGVRLMGFDEKECCNYQYIVIELDADDMSIDRDTLLKVLHEENIIARRYFYPGCHRMEPYRSYQPHASLLLHNTESLVARVLVLPTGTSVQEQDIILIANVIRLAIENGRDVVASLKQMSGI